MPKKFYKHQKYAIGKLRKIQEILKYARLADLAVLFKGQLISE